MKYILAIAALAFISTSAMSADYYGPPGATLPREDCHWLVQKNPHDPWANCPGKTVHAGGHSPDTIAVPVKEPKPCPKKA